MRKKANFALGLTHTSGALPHSKAIRVQCGGLLGLQTALDKVDMNRVDNIHGLIKRALRRFGRLDALPYPEIMRMVSRYRHRRPRARTL